MMAYNSYICGDDQEKCWLLIIPMALEALYIWIYISKFSYLIESVRIEKQEPRTLNPDTQQRDNVNMCTT